MHWKQVQLLCWKTVELKPKMIQIQGKVAGAKTRARVLGGYSQTKDNVGNDIDETKYVYQKKARLL